jgi:hypothetical protein
MNIKDAELQLDRLEAARGVKLTNRTRHMILRAVAGGVTNVGFQGIVTDLATNAGVAAAAALLHFHPAAWLEAIPPELSLPIPSEMPKENPKFGL